MSAVSVMFLYPSRNDGGPQRKCTLYTRVIRVPSAFLRKLGTDHYFLSGGLPFLGLAVNFFQRVMRFKQFFFITFCNENNFFTTILKNVTGFFIDLI